MSFLSLGRVIKFAFQDIVRNFSLSLMTVFILILMLLSVNTLLMIRVLTGESTKLVKEQIDVSIFFSRDASDKQISEVKDMVSLFPEVRETVYLDKDQVLAQFREIHKDNPDITASLDELGENPLGATLIIKTNEPKDYEKIIETLRVPEYEHIIEAKTFGDTEAAISRIDIITHNVELFTLLLSVVFSVIAFLVIFNTIRVAIYMQRVEIGIKKLVGATNWFVRGPYLLEGLVFSLASVVLASALAFWAFRWIDPYVAVIFQQPALLTNYFQSHILVLLAGQFVGVLRLTTASSLLAMRRHLQA